MSENGEHTSSDFLKLVEAMRMMQQPHTVVQAAAPASEDKGLSKIIVGVISALVIAMCIWVAASVSGLGQQVAKMGATLDNIQAGLADLRNSQGQTTQQMGDLRAMVSRDDQRIGANEQAIQRLNDRVRIVEGQPPLPPRQPNG